MDLLIGILLIGIIIGLFLSMIIITIEFTIGIKKYERIFIKIFKKNIRKI